ncbi:MAG: hypothetical protein LBJ48_00575 [Coriobacteriales bacterium]|jgi:hypothetical protein|nr:hypothetical protein [Coriobacteriales bacterium]
MATKSATKAAEATTASAGKDNVKGAGTKIPTAMIPRDLYADTIRLAAYNKIKKTGPQSDSAILREALTAIMKHVGFKPGQTDILASPKSTYVKKLAAIHQDSQLEGGMRKTFSVSTADYEDAEAFASYNKLHGLQPKNISQLCRDALTYYISTIPYKFRPE